MKPVPSSPAGTVFFLISYIWHSVQIPLKGCFSFTAPLRAFAQVLVTSISSSFVPSFKAARNISPVRSSPDCSTVHTIHADSCQVADLSQIQINSCFRFVFPMECSPVDGCSRIVPDLLILLPGSNRKVLSRFTVLPLVMKFTVYSPNSTATSENSFAE